MALSNSILEKIKKDKEDKQNGVKDGTTSTKDKSTQGSNSSSGSSLSSTIQAKVAMDYALKQLGLTHNKDTGLLNDSRYSNYRTAASSVDQNYINKFYSDWKSYNDRMKAAHDGMNWKAAQTWGQDKELDDTGKDLMFRSAMIRSYLDSHKDDLDEESYKGLVTDLENIQKAKGEYDSWFTNTKKFYSQWETEDEYNFWQDHSTVENRQNWYDEQQKRLEDLKAKKKAENAKWNEALVGYDPESYEFMTASQEFYSNQKVIDDEIAAVEAEMANYKRGNYNEHGQYYGNKTLDDYYAITERPDFSISSANRDYDNPTREELWEYDTSASEGSVALGYGGSYDDEGNILDINGNIVRYAKGPEVKDKLGMFFSAGEEGIQEAYNQLSINSGNYTDTWANIMQEGDTQGWKYLEDTEIGIYYALLDDSQEAAYKFLADMAPELTRRETMAKKAYIEEAPVLEQILLNAASIPMNVVGGGVAFAADVISGIKGEEINPYSRAHAMQNTASFIREDTARDINNLTGNVALPWVGTTFGDVYQSLMSAGDMAYGAMLGGGGQVYATLMGMGAASSEAKRLYDQGASMEQIAAGGILAGAAEMVFEKLSIEKLINMKDAKSASQLIKNLLTQGGIEASEEMATEIANTITNVIVMGKQSDWVDLETFARNVVNAGIGGFISGGFGGGVGSVASYSQYNQQAKDTGKTIMEAEGGVDALKALAMDVSGADSKLAKQAGKVSSDTYVWDGMGKIAAAVKTGKSQKAVGKLYDSVQTEVTKQNQTDIAKRIEEVGFSPKSAKNIAGAVMAQVNGEELSKVQKAALDIVKGNEKVQEAISGILEDGSSSMNKRNVNLTKYALGINLGVGIAPDASRTNPAEAGKENTTAEGNLTTEVKRVSEGSYEVSEDGKAVLDGQEVNLDGFRKTDDGTIMVATADNLTADPGEVTYSSKGQALVYENYANIETTTSNPVIANMDINSRSALAKAYDPASGVDAKVYFLGANQAWWYGFEGISMNEKSLPENSLVNSITKEQREFAYEQGRKAGETAAITQSAGIKAAYEKAVEKLGGKEAAKAVAKRNKGEVVLDSGIKKSSMTKQQRGSVQMAKVVAEATGTTIHVYHGVKEYGKYDTNTGEIWLNINAMFTGQSMMAFTLGHELVHMAKQWSPAEYKEFADYLLEQYGKKGVSAEVLIREQMANAKKNDYELNEHEAYEEVIADACQRMLLDSDAVQKMAAYKAENPTRWQQIIDAIKEFIDKIRQLFVGAEPDSTEASIYKELDAAVKKHLEDKFVTMVMDAGEHLSTIRNAFGKGTVVEVNENGEFTLAKGEVNGATKFLYNDYTWENGGRETLAAALKAEGFSKEDIDAALTIMDGKHDLVKDLAKQFPEQDRINNVTITTDLKDGHSVLSALVSNGDYPVNIDLLMVCKKRKAYQRVINRLCETGLIQQATVDALAIAEINKILGKYGFETACLGCFVESRRLRIQEWAQTICKEWNAEVKKRNPNAKAFGFGKGEAKLTADEVMQLIGELESGGEKNDQGNLNLGQGSAVKRMGVLLDKVPSLRRTLSIEDLITPDGLSSLRRFDSNLFSMVKSRYGSNSPKFVQEFNPYNHELAKYGKVPTEYNSLREYLYAIGGARMQSFSDFIVENWFDYCQIVADLATRKLPMHTYTKEIALVKLFGLTGIKINMSLIPDIDRSLGKEYAGLTRNAKGELELIWADKDRFKATGGKSYMQSINFADAIALQNDPRYSANVGTIAVGVSDQHILMMLDDARIRMIIPYHSSGMNPIFADLMGTSYYKDYTMFQNTTVKQLYNSKGQKVTLKLDKTQTGKLTSGFQFNEVLQELGDARAAAEAYKEWCADSSKHTITIKGETYTAELTPKFNDFSGHENYYKLLEDFNTYDCISEQAAPQGDVQQNYPEDFDKILTDELKAQEGHRQKQVANQAFDKAMGEIETYLKSHTKADTVFYAEQHGVKLSAKDKKLGAEDKKKLAELRKGEKMSMPKAEPAPTFYSHMARVVDGLKQEKHGAASVIDTLRNKGVKAEEIKWSGIETWLEGKKSVTKAELQEFIAGSMLQIEEEVLDNKDRPYTEDQKKRLGEYKSKQDEVTNRVADEWKKITGKDLPISIRNVASESGVVNAIIDANKEHKDASFEGRLLKKLSKDLRKVIENNDDFGFDSVNDALRSIHRHRRDFINYYEMSTNDKAVIVKYCNALNAYNDLPNMISDEDSNRLRTIAREGDQFGRKMSEVMREHDKEQEKFATNWDQYKLRGGKNYREMLFRIPGSTYSNAAMFGHWKDRSGVLAHARVQDMDTFIGKMLFIEEIQSDWHNEGHKEGYRKEDEKTDLMLRRESQEAYKEFYTSVEKMLESNANWEDDNAIYYAHPVVVAEMFEGNESHFDKYGFTEDQIETIRSMVAEEAARQEALKTAPKHDTVPDAPFKDTYHEYVLKRLLRIAAEEGYDSIGWTTAATQMDRWNPNRKTNAELGLTDAKNPDAVAFEKAYQIEYDQDIRKFLDRFGDKWGTKVGKTTLDNGTEVWSMAITDSMKDSVLYEGQPKYSMPKVQATPTYEELVAKDPITVIDIGQNDEGLSYAELKEIVLKNAEKNKVFEVPHPNRDTKVLIFLTQKSFTHAFSNLTKDFGEDTILAMDHISEIIHEAVLTHIAPPKNPRKAESRVFTFFAAIEGKRGTEPVKLTVKEYVGQKLSEIPVNIRKYFEENGVQETHNRLYDAEVLEVISVESAKKESGASASVANRKRLGAKGTPNSTIKVADLLGLVNGDAEKYIPKPASDKNKSPNSRGMSSRQLLANAFDDLAQTPKERELMAQYRNNITKVEEVQERLKKLRGEIRMLTNANGDKNKIATMNKTAADLADLIDKYDRKLLELEASKPLRDVLARAKSAAYQEAKKRSEETMKEYRQQVSERFDRGVEGRRKTEMRHKIQNVVKELNDLLLNESKKRHVPDNLKKAVAGALSIVNMDTVGAEDRAAKYAALIAKEQAKATPDQDKIDSYTMTMENILRQGEKIGQRLKELRDAYEEISGSDDPDIANAYDPVIAGAMKELSQTIGNTSIRDMTLDQLSDVYDMYRMVLTRVRDANKTLLENIKESISNLASRVIGEVRVTGGEHTYRAAILDPVRKFLWNNLKPVYAMEWIGSSTLTKVFDNVRAGEDTWAKDVTEAREFYLEKSKKYGYDSWDFEKKYPFESASGIKFELTLEQILSLYAYSKRDQAQDHLRLGGFVFDSNIETYKEKGSKILKYKVNTADAHQITPELLATITGELKKEQTDFVDDMQEYLSSVMGAKGNEVTSKMYGVKIFKEKFYFPLKSAKQFMFEQNEVAGEVRIKNSGFTNKVKPQANNPIILSNFMDVWAGHVNDMSMYHAFTLPLEDFNRVFNYDSPKKEGQPPVSVKGTLQGAYSPAAVNYVKNLITDLNGGARTDSTTGFINKMMGLFKKGAVFASASVVIQQPSAIARAAALVDTKYFIGPKVDHKRHNALWSEVKQYAPVAIIKEMGYFDTNMGKSTQDYIVGKEYDRFGEKMKALVTDSGYRDEILSKAPALADEIAWCGIWEAVKRETQAKYKVEDTKSEAFLKKCGERFTEVITKTQVYDSVLSRSGNMRSKDTGMKMATAFMAEPTTSINMIADALLKGKRGNRKYARKAIGAVIASQILNSILVSFVYAGRDDDEDETYVEKYIGTFTGQMLDSLNPAGYIPFIKDIISIVQGYDVERSDMAVVSDLWKAWENLSKDNVSPYRKVEGFAGSIAQIFGLPVKNIMRDARGIYNTIDSFVNGQQTTGAGIGYAMKSALPAWVGGGDVSNQNQLYEAILSGDQTQIARVKGRFEDETAINSALRKALRENDPRIREAAIAWNANDLDEYMRIAREIIAEKHFVQDDVVMAIRAEASALAPDDGEPSTSKAKGLFTSEKFAEAIAQGDQAMANAIKIDVIQTAQKNGKTEEEAEKSFASTAKGDLKELFAAGSITEAQAIAALTTYCGDTQEEAAERVDDWAFENDYGFKYSDRGDAYKAGAISASELKAILMTSGGKTAEEADLQIQAYDWEAQGYEGATPVAVRDYNEHCAAANVPKDVYLHIRSFSNDTENDVDANGKTIYYSAMKKVMAEINAQYGLTSAQKDAIARSMGWSEKNIKKYKTW